ncbi:MAG: ribonuclease III [Candidatus Acidiferrales bacterium]
MSKELGTASKTGEKLARLEETLGYQFGRPELLELALTHRSARQRDLDAPAEDNERLEFFGDRVLGLIASEYLVQTYPDWDAGKLSKAHSRLVSGAAVRAAAQALDLGRYLRLGRGEEMTGGREKQSLLADAYEAVIAAIYLDGGIEAARSFIRRSLLDPAILHSDQPLHLSDYKSALQEWVQQHARGRVEYRIERESGPDHRKLFEVEAWLNGERLAASEGRSKKEAEQSAARQALASLLATSNRK